jgi:hypothetical protein
MGILHRSVDRRAGESEAEAVSELHAHGHRVTFGVSALLRAMGLVDQANDIVAREGSQIAHVLKRLDCGDECAAPVGTQLGLQ